VVRVIANFLTPFRDFLEWLERFASGLTLTDLVFAVVAVAIAWWVVATVASSTRIGPVEIDPLESDDDNQPLKELGALLRERLARSGLSPPPEVPAGAPRTAIIEAVSTSPTPQGPWLAALLDVLPTPPSAPTYRLSATLSSGEDGCELAYWLRPKKQGRPRVSTAFGATPEGAIQRAATEIYLAITNHEKYAYPHWARWRDSQAFDCYFRGLQAREVLSAGSDLSPALTPFEEAIDREPRNLLPALQMANLSEREAAAPGAEAGDAARSRLAALLRYRDIAARESTIVEARYRYGILLSMLCQDWSQFTEIEQAEIAEELEVLVDDPRPQLRSLADEETEEVKDMLGAWWVLLRKHRLRHRFELKGTERRALKRTVALSERCMWARKVDDPATGPQQTQIRRAERRVRLWEMGRFRGAVGWQAHYNAGCFYALIAARDQGPNREQWLERAFEQLNLAIEQPEADQLPSEWLVTGDTDLDELRTAANAEPWQRLVRRHSGPPQPPLVVRTVDGEPIRSTAQWQKLAPPATGRAWEPHRSGYELARGWTIGTGPTALDDQLGLAIQDARAGAVTQLGDEQGVAYRHDLLAADAPDPEAPEHLASIRAIAEEDLGPTVGERLEAATTPQAALITARLNILLERFGSAASLESIATLRYSLLPAIAATLTAAAERDASHAVFVIHAFGTRHTTPEDLLVPRTDLSTLLEVLFGIDVPDAESGYLVEPPGLVLPGPDEPKLCVAFLTSSVPDR
jgi:hypothetical protein